MTTVAIDFGTSNTVVSLLEPETQTAKTLRFPSFSRLFSYTVPGGESGLVPVIPSLFFVQGTDKILIGETVRSQRLGLREPQRLFKNFKRDLAADFQMPPRVIDGTEYEAKRVAEQFLQQIWQELENLQINPTELIFTVPVGAFERYINWFRDWVEKIGLQKVRFVDESTAAALGYSIQRPESLVLVIDFGGGTLDLSLVRTQSVRGQEDTLKARTIAKADAYIGGEDIDIWIIEDYLRNMGASREDLSATSWQNLLEIAERLKVQLSNQEEAAESWLDEETFMSYDLSLSRDKLEEILEENQFLEQLREAIDEVITTALGKGINKSDIEQVLLVGGSCLIPAVQNLIKLYFGRSRVKLDNPFEAVCHGALTLTQVSQMDDYLRHSYAIRLWEPVTRSYSFFPLFEKGSAYPCKREEALTLQVAKEGQREIRLDIGELAEFNQAEVTYDEMGRMSSSKLNRQSQYRPLQSHQKAVCVAHLDPSGQVGMDRISVEFEVDEKRVLLATVTDLLTNRVLVEQGAIAKLK
ncbi:Hsp70 family protein [Spirulina sp. CS-785/01]|uniref:Hsp70 family protein n=1 Tax=Spirulina sp. CS-785/01 TaxID=3021716 RepID=UPI00232BA0F3|nr:Hsp70 family protein [Spirulina sp. CS-785/01]MDB9315484.1 Hsp70 family protein [Spirulina sp. CS-785/01]